jgi:hypothetical protein
VVDVYPDFVFFCVHAFFHHGGGWVLLGLFPLYRWGFPRYSGFVVPMGLCDLSPDSIDPFLLQVFVSSCRCVNGWWLPFLSFLCSCFSVLICAYVFLFDAIHQLVFDI